MYIEKISITSFGTLKNREYVLSDGFNIVEGSNESGKTTLMNFVLFILYGADTALNKRMKASSELFSGKITLSCEKLGKITISRSASCVGARSNDEFSIISCDTLKEIKIGKTSPGEYILGINRDFFENTVFVSQRGASAYNSEAASSAVQNILNSANEKMSTEKGKKRLDETRKNLKHKNNKGGAIYTISSELSQLEAELEGNKNGRILLGEAEGRIGKLQDESKALDTLPQLIADEKSARCAQRLKALKEQYSELEGEEKSMQIILDDIVKKNESYRNPDAIAELRTLDVDIKMIKARADMLDSSLKLANEQYNSMSQKKKLIPEILDEFLGKIQNSRNYAKKLLFGAISAFSISAIVILLGIVCIIYSEIIASVALLLCAVCALVGGFLFLSHKKKREDDITAELARFDFERDATLREIKDEVERRIDFEHTKQLKQDEINQIHAKAEAEYNFYVKKAKELTARVLLIVPESFDLQLDEQLQCAESKINKSYEAESELKHELDEIAYRKNVLSNEIMSYSIYSSCDLLPNPKFHEYSDSALDEQLHSVIKRKSNISEEIQQLSVQITALENGLRSEAEIEAEILEKKRLLKIREEQFEIVALAQDALAKASDNIRSAVTPNIIKICDRLFSEITNGKYGHIGLDASLSLNGVSGDETRAENELSYGTNEAMYLAFRISLCTVLCQSEMPPLMLDESFAHIDDSRSSVLMKMLSEVNAQTLLFTCSSREANIANDGGLKFNLVSL